MTFKDRSRLFGASTVAVCAAGVLAASAHATPAEGDVVRTDLANGATDAPISIVTNGEPSTLTIQSLLLKPGSSSGWHTHPGPEYSVVNRGTLVVQTIVDCMLDDVGAGRAVFIPAGVAHRVANVSDHDAEAVVTYTLPVGLPVRDDAAAACG